MTMKNEVFHVHGYKPDYRKRQLKTEDDKKRGFVLSPYIHVCAAQNRSELNKEVFGFQRGAIAGKMPIEKITEKIVNADNVETTEVIWSGKTKSWVIKPKVHELIYHHKTELTYPQIDILTKEELRDLLGWKNDRYNFVNEQMVQFQEEGWTFKNGNIIHKDSVKKYKSEMKRLMRECKLIKTKIRTILTSD